MNIVSSNNKIGIRNELLITAYVRESLHVDKQGLANKQQY